MTHGKNADTRPSQESDRPRRKLDPHVLAAARKANPQLVAGQKAALAAEAAAKAAEEAAAQAKRLNAVPGKRVVVAARPTRVSEKRKFTPQLQRQYLDFLRQGLRRGESAKLVGLHYATVTALRKADPAFAQAEADAEAQASEQIENALFTLASEGHMEAIKFWLMNRAPERWKDPKSIKVEVSGQITAESSGDRIAELEARLIERKALQAAGEAVGDVIEAEILDADDADWDDEPESESFDETDSSVSQ